VARARRVPQKKAMPITPNETTAERAVWLAAELQAVEQDAMEELRKKRASLRKAVEEAQQKAQEEAEVTAQERREANMREQEEAFARAEAIRQAQEEPEIQGKLASGPC